MHNRVRQYFQSSRGKSPKILKMISRIQEFEYIVTSTETEALVLENNLIKLHRPPYNTMLKDDKQYPYIKATIQEAYPRIFSTRSPATPTIAEIRSCPRPVIVTTPAMIPATPHTNIPVDILFCAMERRLKGLWKPLLT